MSLPASHSLLGELDASILTGSGERNADMLRGITDLFLAGVENYNEQQLELFDDVFKRLVEKLETQALAELSEKLAPLDKAPAGIVRRLANDDSPRIARPVLVHSQQLSDEELAVIARSKSQEHLLALTQRATLSTMVSDILIARGCDDVVQSLARNAGARISEDGYEQLIERAEHDGELLEIVAVRRDISLPGFRRLLTRATKDVCARLLERVGPEFKKDVHETLLRIFDRVDNDIHRERDIALHEVAQLKADGRLDAKAVLGYCTSGQIAHATAALALLAETTFELVADILDSGQNPALMVVCKGADFPWSITFLILKSRPQQQDIVEFQFDQLLADYCRLTQATARRALRFWESRRVSKSAQEANADSQKPVHIRRASPRSRIHQKAIILVPGNGEIPCVMLDISRGGAKLQSAQAQNVPERFTLTLARNRLIRRTCTVVWRSKSSAVPAERTFGVCFEP
jgi:uncharacterized protein (DUF2336 family)